MLFLGTRLYFFFFTGCYWLWSIVYCNKFFFATSLDEVIANTHSSKPLAAITFDDGYCDFY